MIIPTYIHGSCMFTITMMLVMCVVNIVGERIFLPNSIPGVKFLDNLIGWTLTNAGEVTLELNLSQFQHQPD